MFVFISLTFLFVTPCNIVGGYKCLEEHAVLDPEDGGSCETLGLTYKTMHCQPRRQ
jgi:hypothetical protein